MGTRRCGESGAYLACRCAAVAAPLPEPVQRPNVLGARCLTDTDCGSDLFCWTESSLGLVGLQGGPAGGYCTALCDLDPECLGIDQFSGCIHFQTNSPGMCLAGCISEYPARGEEKCLGRPELACWSFAALFATPTALEVRERGLCMPHCGSDADCSAGTCTASFRMSRCVAASSVERSVIGSPCSSNEDCVGGRFCYEHPGGSSFCTTTCSLGAASSCGFAPDAAERAAACVLPYEWEGGSSFGPGDIGVCAQLCDDDADCASASFECRPAVDVLGRTGACVPRAQGADAGALDSGASR